MLAVERRKIIMDLLAQKGQASTLEMCEKLGVSPATVRSDLSRLEQENLIYKTHGGATLPNFGIHTTPSPENGLSRFEIRQSRNSAEKSAISKIALNHILPGQCILLDASSTALFLANRLGGFSRLTVVTSGIRTMLALKDMPNINVILIGGMVARGSASIEGLLGIDLLNKINIDVAFLSAGGFSLKEGLTDFNLYEVELKKEIVRRCKRRIVLLDSTKLEVISTASFCSVDQIDLLLTDEKAPASQLAQYRAQGLVVEVCPYGEK